MEDGSYGKCECCGKPACIRYGKPGEERLFCYDCGRGMVERLIEKETGEKRLN